MTDKIKEKVDYVIQNFDYELYNQYLNGNIRRYELREKLNCDEHVLLVVFKKLKLKTRYDLFDEQTKHDFFDSIDSEIKAYILGFYLADGSLDFNNNRIHFSQTEKDSELIYLIKEHLCPISHIVILKEKLNKKTGFVSKPMYSISIHSKHICDTLENYGMGRRKTYTCNTDLSFIPNDLMIHFIRGYFDGDGTVCKSTGKHKTTNQKFENITVRISSYKKEHLLILQSFLLNNYEIKTKIYNDYRNCNYLCINSKQDFLKFRDILYKDSNYFLTRKKDKMLNITFDLIPLKKQVKRTNIITGETKTYETIKAASIDFNVSNTSIKNWIKLNKVVENYKWEFIE